MNKHSDLCRICGEGHLTEIVGQNDVEYNGHRASIPLKYSICSACDSEQGSAAQVLENKRRMQSFKKKVEGLLSGEEVRALRKQLGISQKDAALVFGGGPVAFSKYESDDVIQSESMDKLLRVAAALPWAFAQLVEMAALDSNIHSDWCVISIPGKRASGKDIKRTISSFSPVSNDEWRDIA
jgi:HTH-type transcriptional regulator/antitoxin MqsA